MAFVSGCATEARAVRVVLETRLLLHSSRRDAGCDAAIEVDLGVQLLRRRHMLTPALALLLCLFRCRARRASCGCFTILAARHEAWSQGGTLSRHQARQLDPVAETRQDFAASKMTLDSFCCWKTTDIDCSTKISEVKPHPVGTQSRVLAVVSAMANRLFDFAKPCFSWYGFSRPKPSYQPND